jgi:hypothetical protein
VAAADLTRRPLRNSDEATVLFAQQTLLTEGFSFIIGYEDGVSWPEFVAAMEDQRRG